MFWIVVTVLLSGQPIMQFPVLNAWLDRQSCEVAIEVAFPELAYDRSEHVSVTCMQSETEPATFAPSFEGFVGGQVLSD